VSEAQSELERCYAHPTVLDHGLRAACCGMVITRRMVTRRILSVTCTECLQSRHYLEDMLLKEHGQYSEPEFYQFLIRRAGEYRTGE